MLYDTILLYAAIYNTGSEPEIKRKTVTHSYRENSASKGQWNIIKKNKNITIAQTNDERQNTSQQNPA